jgi:hypothetical protein
MISLSRTALTLAVATLAAGGGSALLASPDPEVIR